MSIDTTKVLTPEEFLACMPQCCQAAITEQSTTMDDGSLVVTWHWKCKYAPVDCRDILIYYSEHDEMTGEEWIKELLTSLSPVCQHCTKPQMDIRNYNDRLM